MTQHDTDHRAVPCNIEAEEALLGGMMATGVDLAAVCSVVNAGDFHRPGYAAMFDAIVTVNARGEAPGPLVVAAELTGGRHEELGPELPEMLANAIPSAALAHARIVRTLAAQRRLIAAGRELEAAGYTGADVDPAAILADVIADQRHQSGSGLDVYGLAELAAAVAAAPAPRYLVRSIIAEGDHGMIAAEFKAGKTWAVTDLAVSVASGTPWLDIFDVDSAGPVLLFAGEGGARKLLRRIGAVCEARGIVMDTLPIRVCLRVPHLISEAAIAVVADEIAQHRPRLVIVDPLYLAANGARGSDIYEMGAHLERIQHTCQDAGAALLIVHHWNKTGSGKGAKRMSGAGPDAWGRVLISAAVISTATDPVTLASDVVLDLDFQGDEIPETTVRLRRRVWADDPDDLTSPLHYEVTRIEAPETPTDPALAGLRPSACRVLEALEGPFATDPDGMTVRKIGDLLAVDGKGFPLKPRTIQAALAELAEAQPPMAEKVGGLWRSTRALSDETGGESEF